MLNLPFLAELVTSKRSRRKVLAGQLLSAVPAPLNRHQIDLERQALGTDYLGTKYRIGRARAPRHSPAIHTFLESGPGVAREDEVGRDREDFKRNQAPPYKT